MGGECGVASIVPKVHRPRSSKILKHLKSSKELKYHGVLGPNEDAVILVLNVFC